MLTQVNTGKSGKRSHARVGVSTPAPLRAVKARESERSELNKVCLAQTYLVLLRPFCGESGNRQNATISRLEPCRSPSHSGI